MHAAQPHQHRPRRPGGRGPLFAALGTLLCAALLLDVWTGDPAVAVSVTPSAVLSVLIHHLTGRSPAAPAVPGFVDTIVWSIRLPRAIGGALVGTLLSMAGVAFQSVLMNPIADPYFVGVSSGAGLGASIVLLLGLGAGLAGFAPTLAAFAAGLLTMALVYRLARVRNLVPVQTFLLAGLVVGMALYAITQLVVVLATRSQASGRAASVLSQLLGSLQAIDWRAVGLLLPFGIGGAVLLLTGWRELNMMTFGEESAARLGVDTESFKRRVIIAGTLVSAAAVSVAGIIGFIGMVVPQIARRIVGPDHRHLLPAAMLLGGLVLVCSDWLSRIWLHELPIGVVTTLFGAPMFCWLLRRGNGRQGA